MFNSRLEGKEKVIAAIKWAYANDYFGSNTPGEEFMRNLPSHGEWVVIGMAILMILGH